MESVTTYCGYYCQAGYLLSGKLTYCQSGMHPNVSAYFAPNNRTHAPKRFRIHAPNTAYIHPTVSAYMHPKGAHFAPKNLRIHANKNDKVNFTGQSQLVSRDLDLMTKV